VDRTGTFNENFFAAFQKYLVRKIVIYTLDIVFKDRRKGL